MAISAQRRDSEQAIPSFSAVRQVASTLRREAARQAGQSVDELLPLYEADNQRLTELISEQKVEHESLLQIAENDLSEALIERDEARAELRALKGRVLYLQMMLRKQAQDFTVPIPDDLAEIETWASEHLDNSVVLTSRAIRNARKSLFEDPALAYESMLLLKTFYVPMRRTGSNEAKLAWENGLQQLGLSMGPTFSGSGSGSSGDEYFLDWRGRRRELEWHLKGSSSRDPRYCFRLYFFWCDETRSIVIGSLPSHLNNSLT